MNREQIIRMAREAANGGIPRETVRECYMLHAEELERFATLVAAAEREECAKLCESLFDPDDDSCNEADLCVAAIRARSQQ